MNRLISLVLLIIFSPIFLVVSFVIFFFDGRPIFFRQKRIGLDNKTFIIFKFRTMKNNMENIASHLLNKKESNYIKSGIFLRKYSIDELPQLINILKGDMVFIGPRPSLYNQYDLIKERTKLGIHKLTPGVTGWAQVNGRDNNSLEEKISKDNYYLLNKSFNLNIKIFFLTIIKVLLTSGVKN